MANKFLEAVMLRRAEEQAATAIRDYRSSVCVVCKRVRPQGGNKVCQRCFASLPRGEAYKAAGIDPLPVFRSKAHSRRKPK
jgi:hypothetical protein